MTADTSPTTDAVGAPALSGSQAADPPYGLVMTGRPRRRWLAVLSLLAAASVIAGVALAALAPRTQTAPASPRIGNQAEGAGQPTVQPPRTQAATPPQSARSPQSLQPPQRWRPVPEEVYRNAKRLSAAVVQGLATYPYGSSARGVAGATAARFDANRKRLVAAANELVRSDVASAGTVVYPQLGGLTPTSASVMVVVEQELLGDGGQRWEETRTVDVRLALKGGEWVVDGVSSGGGVPVARPKELSRAAAAVVDHPSIVLADSARWDIYRGDVAPELLALMAQIADRYKVGITTLSTGHPFNVFATDRQSNHTRGRAVDIYSVDGQPVVAQRDKGTPAHKLTRWLFKRGVPELGSPWALDGYGGRSFTDDVHLDHLHVAV